MKNIKAMKRFNIFAMVALVMCVAVLMPSCKKKVEMTSVEIEDQDRHYYPILQGEELELSYGITNIGDESLIINEIQTSCGCVLVNDDLPLVILPRQKSYVHLKYNSLKNIGLVQHYIYCYGNIADKGCAELRFDVHVVPDADYTRDYEELYREYRDVHGIVGGAVDGDIQRRYYVGNP